MKRLYKKTKDKLRSRFMSFHFLRESETADVGESKAVIREFRETILELSEKKFSEESALDKPVTSKSNKKSLILKDMKKSISIDNMNTHGSGVYISMTDVGTFSNSKRRKLSDYYPQEDSQHLFTIRKKVKRASSTIEVEESEVKPEMINYFSRCSSNYVHIDLITMQISEKRKSIENLNKSDLPFQNKISKSFKRFSVFNDSSLSEDDDEIKPPFVKLSYYLRKALLMKNENMLENILICHEFIFEEGGFDLLNFICMGFFGSHGEFLNKRIPLDQALFYQANSLGALTRWISLRGDDFINNESLGKFLKIFLQNANLIQMPGSCFGELEDLTRELNANLMLKRDNHRNKKFEAKKNSKMDTEFLKLEMEPIRMSLPSSNKEKGNASDIKSHCRHTISNTINIRHIDCLNSCTTDILLIFPAEETVRQLCLLDHGNFSQISSQELILRMKKRHLLSISKSDAEAIQTSKNIENMVRRYNIFTYFLIFCILSKYKSSQKAELISRMFDIMDRLLKHNNYFSALIFFNALINPLVRSLEGVWDHLSLETQKRDIMSKETIDYKDKFRSFKTLWHKQKSLPFVPCLNFITGDLEKILSFNNLLRKNSQGLKYINPYELQNLSETLSPFFQAKLRNYCYKKVDPLFEFFEKGTGNFLSKYFNLSDLTSIEWKMKQLFEKKD